MGDCSRFRGGRAASSRKFLCNPKPQRLWPNSSQGTWAMTRHFTSPPRSIRALPPSVPSLWWFAATPRPVSCKSNPQSEHVDSCPHVRQKADEFLEPDDKTKSKKSTPSRPKMTTAIASAYHHVVPHSKTKTPTCVGATVVIGTFDARCTRQQRRALLLMTNGFYFGFPQCPS